MSSQPASLNSKFQDSLTYTESPCLKWKHKQTNKQNTFQILAFSFSTVFFFSFIVYSFVFNSELSSKLAYNVFKKWCDTEIGSPVNFRTRTSILILAWSVLAEGQKPHVFGGSGSWPAFLLLFFFFYKFAWRPYVSIWTKLQFRNLDGRAQGHLWLGKLE